MGTRKSLLLSLCLLALAGLSGYLLLAGDGNSSKLGLNPKSQASGESAVANSDLPQVEGGLQESSGSATERVDVAEQEQLVQASAKAAEQRWITGKVVFSFALPADEQLHVVSLAEEASEIALYGSDALATAVWEVTGELGELDQSGLVQRDGSFRVAIPKQATETHLALSGRYVYSRSSTRFDLEDPDADIILTGLLGSWVRGQLTGPSQSAANFEGLEVELGPDITGSFNTYEIQNLAYTVKTSSDAEGRFEFRGVSNNLAHGIYVEHDELASALLLGIRPEPGERQDLNVRFEVGAKLQGVVLDEAAQPVEGVPISVVMPGPAGEGIGALRETVTDEAGLFTLENVMTGRDLEIVAKPDDYLADRLRLEEKLRDHQVLASIVIELSRGESIAGRVLYPDGEPAAGVKLNLGPDLSNVEPAMMGTAASRGTRRETESAADGTFRMAGLSAGPFKVVGVVESEEGDHPGNWRVRTMGIKAGDQSVELVLDGVTALRGSLTTASDRPIEAFAVHLTLKGSAGMMGIGAERKSDSLDAPEADGSFEAGKIPPGVWEVVVVAEGFAATPMVEVELPQAADSVVPVFVLLPAATVSGVVLNATGTPISGARVTLEQSLGERMQGREGSGPPQAITDHEGKFLLEGIEPGTPALIASLTGYAGSEPVSVEVEAGARVDDVELVLRVGGTIAGEVLGADGPLEGRMIIVQDIPSYGTQHIAQSGPDGEFRFEHLEPGSWQVISMPNVMTGELDAGNGDDMSDLMGGMEIDMVDVVEGEEIFVTLGKPPEDPIEVMGSVTSAGEAVAGSVVVFVPEAGEGMGDMKMCTTNADGDFRLTLEMRGAYLVTVQGNVSTGRQNSIEFQHRIPDAVSSHRMQLELPGGGIAGRVLAADGEPAADCRITLNVDGGIAYGSFLGGQYSEIVTDSEGNYEIEHLRAGSYTLAAGGASMAGLFGNDSAGGRVLRDGLRVKDGEWLRGVDFRLKRSGELTGFVRGSDGKPVSGAAIFVRDDHGRLLERFSMVSTNGAGKFTYGGIAEGEYRVVAKKDGDVSTLSDLVQVKVGGTTTCELDLGQGGTMLVSVADRKGADIRARITVSDSAGNEMTGMLSIQEIMEQFGSGFSSREQRVGPLPPGKYRVEATLDDGRTTRKNITISGGGERKVKLRVN